jgi:hypothetical protein
MNNLTRNSLTLSLAAMLGAAAVNAQADSWITHFQQPSAGIRTVLVDPFSIYANQPSLFIGGIDPLLWVDPTGSGSQVSDPGAGADALGYDSYSRKLYSVHYVVRESVDGGQVWRTVDDFSALGGWASGVVSDGQGNVFVSGRGYDARGDSHWIVRRRTALGAWATVCDWSAKGKDYAASKMCVVNGTLFVVGRAADKWAVQRGRNLGAASVLWDTPFVWAPKGSTAGAVAVTSGSDGSLYVFGVTGDSIAPWKCILQKSVNGGTSWTIVATFDDSPYSNRACDLAFDARGNLHLVGAAALGPTSGPVAYKWVVHTLYANGTWQNPPWFPFGDQNSIGGISQANGISTDASGNVFVAGTAHDSSGNSLAVVQRLVP